MQLAPGLTTVYLLDARSLLSANSAEKFAEIVAWVFGADHLLKLGYELSCDLRALRRSHRAFEWCALIALRWRPIAIMREQCRDVPTV